VAFKLTRRSTSPKNTAIPPGTVFAWMSGYAVSGGEPEARPDLRRHDIRHTPGLITHVIEE